MTKFWRTLILLFAVTAAIPFTSCSDDDEPNSDPDPNGYSSQIVGDWYDSNRSYGMHFSTGGSGYDYTKRSNGKISIDEYFTWKIESVSTLVIDFEGGDQDRFTIGSLSPTSFIVGGYRFSPDNGQNTGGNTGGNDDDDDDTETNVLAGTRWGGRIDGFYYELEFYDNGTFKELIRGQEVNDTQIVKYTIVGDDTLVVDDCYIVQVFGYQVKFKIVDNGLTLKLFDDYETWTFSRMA